MALNSKIFFKSAVWAAIEQYAMQGLQFISGIIMARLLLPSDYGTIAMLYIFIDLAAMLVDMGFTTALIRKKNCSTQDYSTVFYANLIISVALYLIFAICSKFIAEFYSQNILQKIIPIIGLTFIINALYAIPSVKLTKELKFNDRAKISIIASSSAMIIAIILAYFGFGVWALVYQSLTLSLIKLLCYILITEWRPAPIFNLKSLKELSNFGSKVLGSNLIFVLNQNIYNVIIGRYFNSKDLGYFNRADGYAKLIPLNTSTILMKIMLPIITQIQDDDRELAKYNEKVIVITSYIIFPISLLIISTASPLITVMITEKWLECVPILQIITLGIMFEHIAWINWDFLLTKGYSNIVLKNKLYTFIISIILLIMSIQFGIRYVALAKGISSIISVIISVFFLKKYLQINFSKIAIELIKLLMISSTIAIFTYYFFRNINYNLCNIIIVYLCYLIIYIIATKYFTPDIFKQFTKIIKNVKP